MVASVCSIDYNVFFAWIGLDTSGTNTYFSDNTHDVLFIVRLTGNMAIVDKWLICHKILLLLLILYQDVPATDIIVVIFM